MEQFLFNSLVMHIANGLLSGQGQDRRYIDHPNKKKEDILVEDTFKYANAFMKKFKEIEDLAGKPE